ncbi:MAG TPA: hypothetical protein VFY71_03920 [Planctomycetota bacterium]|nr:hypothetical protein [Planctomycetota bacterium]
MRRALAPMLLLLACGLTVAALLSLARLPDVAAARAHRLAAPRSDARSCKPQPPVEASLSQVGADGHGVVTLAFAVTPHADAGALDWSLVLPPGAELLDGVASGALAAGAPGTGPLAARVRLPAGDAGLQVALDVHGQLAASAGAAPGERVRGRRVLTWGRPGGDGRELVQVDESSGARERLAATPVRHREGR